MPTNNRIPAATHITMVFIFVTVRLWPNLKQCIRHACLHKCRNWKAGRGRHGGYTAVELNRGLRNQTIGESKGGTNFLLMLARGFGLWFESSSCPQSG
jgi:hypothetical protein